VSERADDRVIPVIVGPTAAGKTAVALSIARQEPVTILSADSRQVYRGFDIGTAKPTRDELAAAPHRGIDVADPVERYSASRWAESADGWIGEAREAGRAPLVVGGTGFYIRALFAPLFEEPQLDASRRRALEPLLGAMSLADLRRWCEALDPGRAHLGRTQLLRAIEVALLTGARLSRLHAERARAPRHRARYLVVDPGAALAARIERRVRAMFADGWVAEVGRLMATVPAAAPAWNASGYDAVRRLAEGAIGEEDAVRAVVIATRQYAKRQRTWFRHQLAGEAVTMVDPLAPDATATVDAWWRGEGSA
jgi:tRNA dimethylallyltransferase